MNYCQRICTLHGRHDATVRAYALYTGGMILLSGNITLHGRHDAIVRAYALYTGDMMLLSGNMHFTRAT